MLLDKQVTRVGPFLNGKNAKEFAASLNQHSGERVREMMLIVSQKDEDGWNSAREELRVLYKMA